jgi:hypothetical protein
MGSVPPNRQKPLRARSVCIQSETEAINTIVVCCNDKGRSFKIVAPGELVKDDSAETTLALDAARRTIVLRTLLS